ncbi:MAG: hypothetical protein NZT92_00955 [Abditibacteriales bacterium]|nr:hypothetical protein [Abditibacteriales bacterium]MDW8364550.1 hypothetical protein [Abditibacteriales bacterium]
MPEFTNPPKRKSPSPNWTHFNLWNRVQNVFQEIPQSFKSTISVSGIRATEIYAFSEVLGLTIEEEVVRTLNDLRSHWDPDGQYANYRFVRQAQTFPDVLLSNQDMSEIIMGIELKSWYLLAKEGEPSFRFIVTPDACAPQDLFVVVPWVLNNVLSGSPIVFKPYIESARYLAEYRNYWWQTIRQARGNVQIIHPSGIQPYPRTRDEIADQPAEDKGRNFGRIARMGIMDDYVAEFGDVPLLGIKVSRWRRFFKEKDSD